MYVSQFSVVSPDKKMRKNARKMVKNLNVTEQREKQFCDQVGELVSQMIFKVKERHMSKVDIES